MARKRTTTPIDSAPAEVRAAIYLRVSGDEQAAKGYGLDVQRARCTAYAQAHGWVIADHHVYTDAAISGTAPVSKRPALAALLAAIDAGEVNAVVVYALDRLGRKLKLVLELVDQIAKAGAFFASVTQQLNTAGPYGTFILHVMASLAELECGVIAQRMTDGRNKRGLIDGERGGRLPMGYTRQGGAILVDDRAAAYVRQIFTARAQGDTLTSIADSLNAANVPTPRGGTWHASSVSVILNNEAAYRGGLRGIAQDTTWPQILA